MARLVDIASAAVDRAVQLVRTNAPGAVYAKGDRDMVTELDLSIEREVRAFLSRATPDIGFLGEEEGSSADLSGAQYRWVLDPIDGTSNLAHGIPLFAVSLGLVRGQHSVLGVIDVPLLGERFQAVEGGGATLNGTSITRTDRATLAEAIVSIGDYAVGQHAAERNRERLALTELLAARVERVRMFGSAAIDLAWVACGRLDASIMLSNKPWDTAAGVAIAREAGAIVSEIDGTAHTAMSQGVVSASALLHDDLIALVLRAL